MSTNLNEIWLPVKGFEGYYEVSSLCRLKSLERKDTFGRTIKEKIRKVPTHGKSYIKVGLSKGSKVYYTRMHRIVAEAFIPNNENKPYVNHKNGIKDDNRVENLEWCSLQDNIKHSILTGLKKVARGERCRHSKLTEKQVYDIFNAHGYQKDIAALFGVSKSTVYEIKRAKRWKHLNLKSNSQQLRYSA